MQIELSLEDYSRETGELRVRKGKGNKARIVWLTNGGQLALDTWLLARGTAPGPLLLPVKSGSNMVAAKAGRSGLAQNA